MIIAQFFFICKNFTKKYNTFAIFKKIYEKFLKIFLKILLFNNYQNMDMSKMGDLLKLQQEAMKIKKELENTLIEAEV